MCSKRVEKGLIAYLGKLGGCEKALLDGFLRAQQRLLTTCVEGNI